MWSFLLVFLAVIARPALAQESTDVLGDITRPAQEKNLLQFAKMIWTVTGRNPLDYNNYGCYCGHGGAGTPVDDIDRCCQAHERCYDTVDYPKFTTYTFTAARGTVTCLDAVGCNERAVCDCDRDAVLCLNRYAYTGKKPCVQTTTPPSPTTYPPEPTTTYLTTPPGPTPVGCDFDGQFYPPGTTIQDIPGCFGHVIICDEDGELRHGDYFGHGCCEHDGQYYEDGETIITAEGVFCYCEGSDTDEAAPMICGETTPPPTTPPPTTPPQTTPPPTTPPPTTPPPTTPPTTTPPTTTPPTTTYPPPPPTTTYPPEPPTTTYPLEPPTTTYLPGCLYNGRYYPPGAIIHETFGCLGSTIFCDEYSGDVAIGDRLGLGCCMYDGEYYEDGETITTVDGVTCICEADWDNLDSSFLICEGCEYNGQVYDPTDGVTCRCYEGHYLPGYHPSLICEVESTTPSPTTSPPEPTTYQPTPPPQTPPPQTPPPPPPPPGCDFNGQFYPPGTIEEVPGCFGYVTICGEDGELIHGDNFGYGCCEHDGQYYEDGETIITADGVFCYCEGSDTDEAAPMICGGTSTPPLPTTYPPQTTTTYPPETTTRAGCEYNGQFYPTGSTIEEVTGCLGYTIFCDEYGVAIADNFGFGCCMQDGEYYEDGEIITTANGATCRCERSDSGEPVPMTCEEMTTTPLLPTTTPQPTTTTVTLRTTTLNIECYDNGGYDFYPVGIIEEVPGCFGYTRICEESGEIIRVDNFGYGCCEYDGQYYEDGETITTAYGATCHCVGSDTEEAAPMICEDMPPPIPTTWPPTTPRLHGCEYGGQFYPPNTIIEETPGCFGRTVCCDEYGQIVIWENWGYQCCEYNGQYYEDGETITRADGATCHCEGSNTYEPAPMICDDQQVYLTTVGTWQFYKVRVTGQMTNANVKATCEAAGMRYPCYSSGRDGCTNYYWASDCICYDAAVSCLTHEVLSAHLCGTTAGAGSRCEPLDDTFAYMPIWLHGDDSAIGVDYQTHTYGLYGADYNNMYALCAGAGP